MQNVSLVITGEAENIVDGVLYIPLILGYFLFLEMKLLLKLSAFDGVEKDLVYLRE